MTLDLHRHSAMPTLGVEQVASIAIRAILANEERVYIPYVFGILIALKE